MLFFLVYMKSMCGGSCKFGHGLEFWVFSALKLLILVFVSSFKKKLKFCYFGISLNKRFTVFGRAQNLKKRNCNHILINIHLRCQHILNTSKILSRSIFVRPSVCLSVFGKHEALGDLNLAQILVVNCSV